MKILTLISAVLFLLRLTSWSLSCVLDLRPMFRKKNWRLAGWNGNPRLLRPTSDYSGVCNERDNVLSGALKDIWSPIANFAIIICCVWRESSRYCARSVPLISCCFWHSNSYIQGSDHVKSLKERDKMKRRPYIQGFPKNETKTTLNH